MPRLLVLLILLCCTSLVQAQQVRYEVAFPNIVHHEAEITVTFEDVPRNRPLEVRMSRTSPGRYALHEFAKNVYNVRATDSEGNDLPITRPNPHQWDVADHDGTVQVRYTLFGDRADGTYTGLDATHAHMNIPATFMWARGMEDAPITITFTPYADDWRAATQLFPTDDPFTFTAPNLAYFLDSPTELSAFSLREWPVEANGETYTIRLAVHHDGTEEEVDDYAEMAEKVVAQQIAVFGEPPDFEPGTYTFIACYLPHVSGDGMEHRNSTILTSTRPLETLALRNLGTVSHEFFHAWNVERIRPAALEPFDFEAANMSGDLWFAEGFTSYYTSLFIRRAGLIDDAEYASRLSGTINAVLNSPGRSIFSAVEMSYRAPFVDAAVSIDPQNRENIFISYYTWGSGIGLGLDLTLRSRFDLTLDDYMQAMWEAHGVPETPYTRADQKRVLADLTGDTAFVDDFFARYIEGHEAVDYETLLARAGLWLRPEHENKAWVGARVEDGDGGARVSSRVLRGSPLYLAGVSIGDTITRLGDLEVTSADHVEAFLALHQPGDIVPIHFTQRGHERQGTLTLGEDPAVEVGLYEDAGFDVSPEQLAFRAAWLGAR